MKFKIGFPLLLALVLAGCSAKKEWQKNNINRQEQELTLQAQQGKVDTTLVNGLLKSYETYAATYPADTTGAAYLFKAADFYRYMHRPLRSIELYATIYTNYPLFTKRPYALFLQGFIYENEAANPHAAKALYEKFLKEYPSHPIAKDVQTTLNNLGKTPEQLIEEFEQKAAADSVAAAKP